MTDRMTGRPFLSPPMSLGVQPGSPAALYRTPGHALAPAPRRAPGRALPALCGIAIGAALLFLGPVRQAAVRALPAPLSYGAAVQMQAGTGAQGGAGARPATSSRIVSCEPLPHVPGKSITTVMVGFPPDAYTPRHRHPGSVTAVVVEGRIRSQLAGGPAGEYGVGESFFEPPGAIHLFAENASRTEPAALLAVFVADSDCGPLTVFDPPLQ